jgi:hypothetical protein
MGKIKLSLAILAASVHLATAQSSRQNLFTGGYNLIPLCAALIILYLVSLGLSKRKIIIDAAAHRAIWNILLLLSFLGAGITGLLLAIRLDLRWDIPLTGDISYWHAETGIAMAIIAVFHCAWHWKYFLSVLRGKKGKVD